MIRRSTLLGAFVLLVVSGGCAKRAAVSAPAAGVAGLRAQLAEWLSLPNLQRSAWAALIQSLDNGETLYSLNAGRLMMPASNMKIVTLAAAAERLGWDHRFLTRVFATGPIEDGVLRGDLVIVGTGDPTIMPDTLSGWVQQLRDYGLRSISGRIIGDDNAFDDEGLGAGWSWDYLADGSAAPTGALEFHENVIVLTIQPGTVPGAPALVTTLPERHSLTIVNNVSTAAPDGQTNISLHRQPGATTLEISGSVRSGDPRVIRTAAIINPTEFFVDAFRQALLAGGVTVSGGVFDIDVLPEKPGSGRTEVLVYESPPLSEIAKNMMTLSQNVYADTLLKALGATSDIGSAATGRKIVAEVLEDWGLSADSYVMYDGSGLSRYNYVTAEMIVRILRRMAEDPKHEPFMATLAVAGVDGTLSRRMRGTRAEGNVRAKTGSIANVRTLSGYVTTADGERLVFSILANHFTVSQAEVASVIDRIVERLAGFSRGRTN